MMMKTEGVRSEKKLAQERCVRQQLRRTNVRDALCTRFYRGKPAATVIGSLNTKPFYRGKAAATVIGPLNTKPSLPTCRWRHRTKISLFCLWGALCGS